MISHKIKNLKRVFFMEIISRKTWVNEQLDQASHLLSQYGELSFIILKISRIATELLTYSALAKVFTKPYKFLKKMEDLAVILKGISSLPDLFKQKLNLILVIKTLSGLILFGINILTILEKANIFRISPLDSDDYKKLFLPSLINSISAILLNNKKRNEINSEQKKIQSKVVLWGKMDASEWQQYMQDKITKCQQKMSTFTVNCPDYNVWENKSVEWGSRVNRFATLNSVELTDRLQKISNLKKAKSKLKLKKLTREEKINYITIFRNGINIASLFLNNFIAVHFFKIIVNSIDISLATYIYNRKKTIKDIQKKIIDKNLEIWGLINV